MDEAKEPAELLAKRMDDSRVIARRAALLECLQGRITKGRRRSVIVLTLGYPDAAVDQIAVELSDARRLFYKLVVAFRWEKRPLGPATENVILKGWTLLHSVLRAGCRIPDDGSAYLQKLEREMPELVTFIEDELKAIERILKRNTKPGMNLDRMMRRLRKFLCLAIDTARSDT